MQRDRSGEIIEEGDEAGGGMRGDPAGSMSTTSMQLGQVLMLSQPHDFSFLVFAFNGNFVFELQLYGKSRNVSGDHCMKYSASS